MPAQGDPSGAGAPERGPFPRLVLDTNVLVAAGFNPQSSSARILERVRAGTWILVWNRETRRETDMILGKIPPLSTRGVAELFRPQAEFTAETHPERFGAIEDPDDRKFAALAAAAGAVLVSNDDHLLSPRARIGVEVLTPGEALRRYRAEEEAPAGDA